ncbi:uncharacterized protein LOC133477080 [Phyllopteryx taeniolatus]|uniref:uncharacterized protein LOC133477080 n=1 Tax=Phyllopteryx taeniolatus TaxID=161469 RepID=UPI002AD42ACE|nr:uncharacterized protein LOC133477080 [Phyllopteryx taeniolatus]
MFFLILAAALLPAGLSAPVADCDTLTRRVQIRGLDQFLGVWTYAAESTNMPGSKILTKTFVDNVWGKIYPANESDSFFVFQVQKMFGRCYSVTSKLTLVNNTLHMEHPISATEVLITTSCPDCILLLSNYTLGESVYRGIQLLTRRAKVTTAEMDEFKRQVACLDLPSPAILDADKGFCSDGSASKDTETTDLTSMLSQADPEYMKALDNLLSSQGGIKTILQFIAS